MGDKITPQMIAECDQAAKAMVDTFPPMLWGLYRGCLKQGFNEEQAMKIVLETLSLTQRER